MQGFVRMVRISRPALWPVSTLVFLAGVLSSGAPLTALALLQAFVLLVPYSLFLYGINDINDYESDRRNPRKGRSAGEKVHYRGHTRVLRWSLTAGLLLLPVAAATMNVENILLSCWLLFLSHAYSAPPFRLKERPPLDSVSCTFIYLLLPYAMGFTYGGTVADISVKLYYLALGGIGLHAFTTLMDYTADKRAGDRTFAQAFGKRPTVVFAAVTFLVVLLFSGIQNLVILMFLVLGLVGFFAALPKPDEKTTTRIMTAIYVLFVVCCTFLVGTLLV